MPTNKKLLVVDFDNTLFDWVSLWHACFSAMMTEVSEISGVPLEAMREEIRAIHREHRTSEYAFLLEAIPSLRPTLERGKATDVFATAIAAFRNARKENLRLYPTVADALLRIKGSGTRIVIYTESLSYYSFYRLKRLGLDGVVDVIYTPPDHDIPSDLSVERMRAYKEDFYHFRFTRHEHTPLGELKPNPDILQQIITELDVLPEQTVYVGDSRHKDVAMAQDAGVDYAWAKYGESQETTAYEMLKSVTHWTDEDVERERLIRQREVLTTVTLEQRFIEIMDHFQFQEFSQ